MTDMSIRRYTVLAALCLGLGIIFTAATVATVFYCIAALGDDVITPAKLHHHRVLLRAAGVGAGLSLLMVIKAAFFVIQVRRLHVRELAAAMNQFSIGGFTSQVTPQPIRGLASGDLDQLGSNFADMTERIAEKIRELSDAEDRLRNSVAELSHDLRTPLALLRGYVETLLSKGTMLPPAEQQNYLRIALRHAARLERLVSELFELTELESPTLTLERGPVALDDFIEDLTREFSLRSETAGIHIKRMSCEKLPAVHADGRLIARVFENLLDNALRFTPRGGKITISCRVVEDGVETEIRDTGEGIAVEDLPSVFDRFYRARDADRHGSGLGLAIVRRILQLHGSEIQVASKLGSGTAFTFVLPTTDLTVL